MQTAIQLKNGLTELPDEVRKLSIRWADPATPSRSASADAAMKLVSSGILPPDSDVALEMVGLSDADILRIQAHRQRKEAPNRLAGLLEGRGETGTQSLKDAQALKANADAFGALIRAGVKSEDAARLAGITGVSFHEGMPVTIREVKDGG